MFDIGDFRQAAADRCSSSTEPSACALRTIFTMKPLWPSTAARTAASPHGIRVIRVGRAGEMLGGALRIAELHRARFGVQFALDDFVRAFPPRRKAPDGRTNPAAICRRRLLRRLAFLIPSPTTTTQYLCASTISFTFARNLSSLNGNSGSKMMCGGIGGVTAFGQQRFRRQSNRRSGPSLR